MKRHYFFNLSVILLAVFTVACGQKVDKENPSESEEKPGVTITATQTPTSTPVVPEGPQIEYLPIEYPVPTPVAGFNGKPEEWFCSQKTAICKTEDTRVEYEYNQSGAETRVREYRGDDCISETVKSYHENGMLAESILTFYNDSSVQRRVTEKYDTEGQRLFCETKTDETCIITEYLKDESGKFVKIQRSVDGKEPRRIGEYEYSDRQMVIRYYGENGEYTGKRVYLYDEKDRLLSQKLYNADDAFLYEGDEYAYGPFGVIFWERGDGEEGFRHEYKYDENGKLIADNDTFYYYENGILCRVVCENAGSKYEMTWKDGYCIVSDESKIGNPLIRIQKFAASEIPTVQIDFEESGREFARNVNQNGLLPVELESYRIDENGKKRRYCAGRYDEKTGIYTELEYAIAEDGYASETVSKRTDTVYDCFKNPVRIVTYQEKAGGTRETISEIVYEYEYKQK